MKLLFVSVGKKHAPQFAEATNDFTARIGHYAPIEWRLVQTSQNIETEGEHILAALDEKDYIILLDEKGQSISSDDLAQIIEKRLNAATRRLVFIIGGAFGISEEVRDRANEVIALSELTYPHQLVRLILAEQVYRAFTILRGEKYHHS